MKRAKFPAPGSVVTRRPFIVPSAPAEGESTAAFERRRAWCEALAHVEVDVRLLRDDPVNELRQAFVVWSVAEEKRKADLEAAGQHVPVLTPEGRAEVRELQRRTIRETIVAVRGVDVGEVESDALTGDDLINLLADAGLLADIATVGRDAQTPTPQQLER